MIGSIRAMRLDNVSVDGRTIPSGWLSENGLNVRVVRELCAFKEDGTIARAGESYHNTIYFTSDYGLDEKRIFRLPGSHVFHDNPNRWSQETVDAEVYYMLDKNQRLIEMRQRDNQKRAEAQAAHDQRIRQRDSLIELFFSHHGKTANTFRVGQWVATRNGLIWKVDKKNADSVILCASNGVLDYKTMPADEILIPANDRIIREFRSMLRGISY